MVSCFLSFDIEVITINDNCKLSIDYNLIHSLNSEIKHNNS